MPVDHPDPRGGIPSQDTARWRPTPHSGVQLTAAFAFGLVVGVVTLLTAADEYAPLAGWDAAALVYVPWVWAAVVSVVVSWTLVHVVHTVTYARTYYTIRAVALRHALLSYLFGAVIIATLINLIGGSAAESSAEGGT